MSKRSERKLRERIERELRDRDNIRNIYDSNPNAPILQPSGHSTDPLDRFTSPTSSHRKLPKTQYRPPPPPRGTVVQQKEVHVVLCHLVVGNSRYLVAFGVGEDADVAMEQLAGELEKDFLPETVGIREVSSTIFPEDVWLYFANILHRFVGYERGKYKSDVAGAWTQMPFEAELPTPEPQQQPSVPTRSKPNPLKGRRQ